MSTNFYRKLNDWFGIPLHSYCPVALVLPLHYSAIIEKWWPFCTEGGHFYHENFSKQHSGATFRIPALNDIIVLH